MNRCYLMCKAVLVGVSIVALSGLTTLKAQEVVDESQLQMYFAVGSGHLKLGNLNDDVQARGLPAFGKKALNLEVGTHYLIQQLILDGGVGVFAYKNPSTETNRASLFGAYTQVSLGVNFILPGEAWQLYPFFTLGVGAYRYAFSTVNEFNDVKVSSSSQTARWMPTFITGTGAALYYTAYNRDKTRAFSLGIRGGVLLDPTRQTNWYKDGDKYRDGPSPLFAGPYLQFVIATGRYFK